MKNKIISYTKLSLYCALIISVQATDAIDLSQFSKVAYTALVAATKLAKVGAYTLGAYLATRSFLNHCIVRSDTVTCSIPSKADSSAAAEAQVAAIRKLVVYTDGKVTVRQSQDGTSKVTHEYGTARRSDLPRISFSERFDPQTGTLTVQGLLRPGSSSKFQQFLQWLFRIRPQIKLHHIIEVPKDTQVNITTENSDQYTSEGDEIVRIEKIDGNIAVHAENAGGVLVQDDEQKARITVHKRQPSDPHQPQAGQAQHPEAGPMYKVIWDTERHPERKIEIHTKGKVTAANLIGSLYVYETKNVLAQGHPQNIYHEKDEQETENPCGKVFIDGVKLPHLASYPAPIEDYIAQPFKGMSFETLLEKLKDNQEKMRQLTDLTAGLTPAQKDFLVQHWSLEQLYQWEPAQRELIVGHLNEHDEEWTREQLLHWLPEQLQNIPYDQGKTYMPLTLFLRTWCWTAEQIDIMVPTQYKGWKELLLTYANWKKQHPKETSQDREAAARSFIAHTL